MKMGTDRYKTSTIRAIFLLFTASCTPNSTKHIEVEALSNCSIGTIDRDVLEQTTQRHPMLGQALWLAGRNDRGKYLSPAIGHGAVARPAAGRPNS